MKLCIALSILSLFFLSACSWIVSHPKEAEEIGEEAYELGETVAEAVTGMDLNGDGKVAGVAK